jgi:uncharacterized protein YdaU (DUF1376 family)
MANKLPWMPFDFDAFFDDTRHLSEVEQIAYLKLLWAAWKNSAALPDDDQQLQKISGLHPRIYKRSSDTLRAFFRHSNGTLTQKRVTRDWQKAMVLYQQRVAAGAASAEARALKRHDTGSASVVTSAQTSVVTSALTPVPQKSERAFQHRHLDEDYRESSAASSAALSTEPGPVPAREAPTKSKPNGPDRAPDREHDLMVQRVSTELIRQHGPQRGWEFIQAYDKGDPKAIRLFKLTDNQLAAEGEQQAAPPRRRSNVFNDDF